MKRTKALRAVVAAVNASCLLALAALSACGGSTNHGAGDGTAGSTNAGSGGAGPANAGATSGGHANGAGSSGGGASSGGASSGGASSGGTANGGASSGGTAGAGTTIPAYCGAGTGGLAPEVKACETDADCEPMPTQTCCGPSVIVGIVAQDHKYEACFPAPTGCPAGLGCASQATTEDGQPAGDANVRIKVSCSDSDAGTKMCRTLTMSASEGTQWTCSSTFGAASACEPVVK